MRVNEESETLRIRRLAEDLAKGKTSTAHLLAAIAGHGGHASHLLTERHLSPDVLLQAARVTSDDHPAAVDEALTRAKDFAKRAGPKAPSGLHLLFVLCQEAKTAAYRSLVQCGTDVSKLRSAAMQLALGIVVPRRKPLLMDRARQSAGSPDKAETRTVRKVRTLPRTSARHAPRPTSPSAPHKAPTLFALATDLAALSSTTRLYARETALDTLEEILGRKTVHSPCVVGSPGSGKSALLTGLSQRLSTTHHLFQLRVSELLSGAIARGSVAERIAALRKEARQLKKPLVLIVDPFEELASEAGASEAIVELVAGARARDLSLVLTTTEETFKKQVEAEPALHRQLVRFDLPPISEGDAREILQAFRADFEAHHGVKVEESVLEPVIAWTTRYLPNEPLPDKALRVLDAALSRAKKQHARSLGKEHVAHAIAMQSKIPADRILETDGQRMLRLEGALSERVVGHKPLLSRIATVLRRNVAGFRSARPIGTFLLLGPTGVGKTETAKAVAECVFHSPHAMVRLDLSEYAEPHTIARLLGAPPGYIGHDAGGMLTEAVRKNPHTVILLDEVEKAHLDVLLAFLQVFDEGKMTDGRGVTVDFSHTIIFMTSNLGAGSTKPKGRCGFGAEPPEESEDAYVEAARKHLPPEFVNRIDEILSYLPLSEKDIADVAGRMLARMARDLLSQKRVTVCFDDSVVPFLLTHGGYDDGLGARPMRRAIGKHIEALLAEALLRGEIGSGDTVWVTERDRTLVIEA